MVNRQFGVKMDHYDIVIIGAGITGLTAGHKLAKAGKKILILEKQHQAGGMLRSFKKNGYAIEEYYHHLFPTDTHIMKLLDELGIKDRITWRQAPSGFMVNNKTFKLSSPFDFLFFKPLNIIDKINFVRLMIKIKLTKNPEKYDTTSAETFILQHSSKAVFQKIFKPLLKSKFGDNSEDVSAAWLIRRLQLRSKTGIKGEILGYMRHGFYLLVEELSRRFIYLGGTIKPNAIITKIQGFNENPKAKKIISFNGKKASFDYLISTMNPDDLSEFITFDDDFKKKIDALEYQDVMVVLLSINKRLTNYYWTNIIRKDIIFGAVVEHTNFMPPLDYNHEHLVYLTSYPDKDSSLWDLSEDQITKLYIGDLKKLFPIDDKNIKFRKVFKGNAGLVYKKGVHQSLLGFKTPYRNLFISGAFNQYPERTISRSVHDGNKIADEIIKENEKNPN